MKISIVVPVYNKENFIKVLYNSIEEQTYKNYEIIFIDDGSTDNSYRIINNLAKENSKIKIIKQENSGPGEARKKGLSLATGDLIFFVDSDDYLPDSEVLKKINEIFVSNDIDVLFFDRVEIGRDFKENIYFFDDSTYKEGKYGIEEIPDKKIHGGLGCKIFKNSILTEKMFIKASNYEDYYTSYLYLDRCNNYYYLPNVLYVIYHGDDNISITNASSFNSNKQAYFDALNISYELYEKIQNTHLKKQVEYLFPNLYLKYFKFLFQKKFTKNERKDLSKKILLIKRIIKKDKIQFYSDKYCILKRIIYKILLFI